MKTQITFIKRLLAIAAATTTLAGVGSSAFAGGNVLPPQSDAFGHTHGEWLAKWWQWSLAFPVNADPENGTADISARTPIWCNARTS